MIHQDTRAGAAGTGAGGAAGGAGCGSGTWRRRTKDPSGVQMEHQNTAPA